MTFPRKALSLGLILLLCACAPLRTAYVRPDLAVPSAWPQAATVQAIQGAWWRRFGDERLNRLVERVLARDNDLAAAAVTLQRARLQARFAVINPTVSGGFSYYDNIPLGGGPATITFDGFTFPTGNGASQSFSPSLQASYEVDLFQALAAQHDVAKWEARATEQDLEAARITLIGQTVNFYFRLGYLNGEIARTQANIAYAQRVADLIRLQVDAGSASARDEAVALQTLATGQAALHTLVEQRVEAREGLNLLLNGESAAPDDEPAALADSGPPPVDAGLPASLLARRPDLRAAEMRLHEQLANVDQNRLSLYPTLSLTGSLGTSSSALSNLLQNPVGALGANIALPFLNYNQVRLNVGVSRATYRLTATHFRQTVYQALSDVRVALAQRQAFERQAEDQTHALDAARALETFDRRRYDAGALPLRTLLDDQENRRAAETALAQVRLSQLQAYVALCKALGGDASA